MSLEQPTMFKLCRFAYRSNLRFCVVKTALLLSLLSARQYSQTRFLSIKKPPLSNQKPPQAIFGLRRVYWQISP
jgi:hypothetical protein